MILLNDASLYWLGHLFRVDHLKCNLAKSICINDGYIFYQLFYSVPFFEFFPKIFDRLSADRFTSIVHSFIVDYKVKIRDHFLHVY